MREIEHNMWQEKETYFDKDGKAVRTSFARDEVGKPAMKRPVKIDVIVENGMTITEEELKEVMKKVDVIRNEQPLTEAHFIIKC